MPRRAYSMTHGVVPPWPQFIRDIRREDPDEGKPYWAPGEPYRMEFHRGHDRELIEKFGRFSDSGASYGRSGYQGDEKTVYAFVKWLARKEQRGDEEAGQLASSIMTTLGYEWI
jgi:hypothetical protein